jgi:hypothetical protein
LFALAFVTMVDSSATKHSRPSTITTSRVLRAFFFSLLLSLVSSLFQLSTLTQEVRTSFGSTSLMLYVGGTDNEMGLYPLK